MSCCLRTRYGAPACSSTRAAGACYLRRCSVLCATARPARPTLPSPDCASSHRLRGLPCCHNQVHAPPFVCFEVSVDYYDLRHGKALPTTLNTDEIAAIVMLFARSVLLVRWMPYISGLTRTHSRAYANLNHLTLTTWFSIRINVMRFPVRFLGAATTLLVLMLAFTMQATERRVNPNLDHYSNCVWLVLSGMTATGFGDFYPQTPLGRLVSTVAFMWGALMGALTVMTVIRQAELSNSEVRVNNMIERTTSRSRLKQRAAFYVQAAWGAYLERLQRSQSAAATASLLGNEPLHADPKFCRTMRDFRVLRKQSMTPDDVRDRPLARAQAQAAATLGPSPRTVSGHPRWAQRHPLATWA